MQRWIKFYYRFSERYVICNCAEARQHNTSMPMVTWGMPPDFANALNPSRTIMTSRRTCAHIARPFAVAAASGLTVSKSNNARGYEHPMRGLALSYYEDTVTVCILPAVPTSTTFVPSIFSTISLPRGTARKLSLLTNVKSMMLNLSACSIPRVSLKSLAIVGRCRHHPSPYSMRKASISPPSSPQLEQLEL